MLTKIIALDLSIKTETSLNEILISIREQPENIKQGFRRNQDNDSLWRYSDMCKADDDVIRGASYHLVSIHKELTKIEQTIRANTLSVDIGNKLTSAKIELSQMMKLLKKEYKDAADFWGYFDQNIKPKDYVYNV